MLFIHCYILVLLPRYSVALIDNEGIAIVGAPDTTLYGIWGEEVFNYCNELLFSLFSEAFRSTRYHHQSFHDTNPDLDTQPTYSTAQDPFGKLSCFGFGCVDQCTSPYHRFHFN